MAWRQYHENSVTDPYEIAAVTSGSNKYYHMKCFSLERNMQDDIHNNKYDWLCSNCLTDIFPFNQIEDENEFIDECQLRMKASLKHSDLIYNPFESNS